MSRTIDVTTQAALAQRRLVRRNLFWITAPAFADDVNASVGFWDDIGQQYFTVIDGATAANTTRLYTGSGTLISCDDIPLTGDLSVRQISATLSQINDAIDTEIRAYNLKGAPVEIHRLLLDPDSRQQVYVAIPRFLGFVDGATINTPTVNQPGSVTLRLVSHTRELGRSSTQKRSHEDQLRRDSEDDFLKFAGVIGQVELFWGEAKARATSGSALTAAQQLAQASFKTRGLIG